jgi:hypothetical protein
MVPESACVAGSGTAAGPNAKPSARRDLTDEPWTTSPDLGRASLGGRRLTAALEEARVAQAIHPGGEPFRRAAPLQAVNIPEQRLVGPEGCEILEQRRPIPCIPKDAGRELLDRTISVQQPHRGDLTDAGDARVAILASPTRARKSDISDHDAHRGQRFFQGMELR